MKTAIITGAMVGSIWLVGCNQPTEPSDNPTPSSTANANATKPGPAAGTTPTAGAPTRTVTGSPVLQPILTVWQEGDTTNAVNLFVDANWNVRPIFPPGMALGLTDSQFKALSATERQARNSEVLAQLDLLKHLATAVDAAGQTAAKKGDSARARKCYTALGKFGLALDDPTGQQFLRQVGQVSKNMASHGLSKIPP